MAERLPQHLFGQSQVLAPGLALLIILQHRHAHDLGLFNPRIQFNKCLIAHPAIKLLELGADHFRSGTLPVEHGDQYAGLYKWVGFAFYQFDQLQNLVDPMGGQVIALTGDDDQMGCG